MNNTTNSTNQTITVPLNAGDTVCLFEEVDNWESDGFTADTLFEDTVTQYTAQTGLLKFEDSDVGLAAFNEMVESCDGLQIV
jgi:hypothetical protein